MKQLAAARASAIKASLARHRLVLVQMGAAFDCLRQPLLDGLDAELISVVNLLTAPGGMPLRATVVVTDLEHLVSPSANQETTMGALRETVFGMLDSGKNVCLVSRAPRVAFASIPGSSLLEDAALFHLPLLSSEECPENSRPRIGWAIPAIGLPDDEQDIGEVFISILGELGAGVLSALDHCLFEVDPRGSSGLSYLSHRDKEALRCAGLIKISDVGAPSLTVPHRAGELKSALADVISATTAPARDLAPVVNGLWFIERTIRASLRSAAITALGDKWRSSILAGGLAAEVLKRARLDSSITAASVKELRDPLEWLTLGELLDVVKSVKFDGLGIDPIIWKRFAEQVMPIRNRVSHMRDLKGGDEEVVGMWVGLVRQQFRK